MNQMITPDQMRLLGGITHDPGYLLLMDLLQARHDNLITELGDSTGDDKVALSKLKYFQAFREILDTLKTVPANFAAQAENEPSAHIPDEFTGPQNSWLRYQRDRFSGIPDPDNPVEY